MGEHSTIWINQKELAAFLKVSPNTIRTYVREGVIAGATSKRGYNLQDAVVSRDQWRLRTTRQTSQADEKPVDDLDKVKVAIEEQKLQKLRTENARALRELVPVSVLEVYASKLGSTVKDGLDSLVGSVKKRLPHLRSAELNMIRQEIAKTSNALADFDPNNESAARG